MACSSSSSSSIGNNEQEWESLRGELGAEALAALQGHGGATRMDNCLEHSGAAANGDGMSSQPPAAEEAVTTPAITGAAAAAEDLRPGSNARYGRHDYWEKRFTEEESYEWLVRYDDVRDAVRAALPPDMAVPLLIVGCGNSRLSAAMFADGYTDVLSTDYSATVIAAMAARHADADADAGAAAPDGLESRGGAGGDGSDGSVSIQGTSVAAAAATELAAALAASAEPTPATPTGAAAVVQIALPIAGTKGKAAAAASAAEPGKRGLRWAVADATMLAGLADGSFAAVVDKACMDALVVEEGDPWSPEPAVVATVHRMCAAVSRVLRPGGRFLQISFAQPHFRRKYLLGHHLGLLPQPPPLASSGGDDCHRSGGGGSDGCASGDCGGGGARSSFDGVGPGECSSDAAGARDGEEAASGSAKARTDGACPYGWDLETHELRRGNGGCGYCVYGMTKRRDA
ncbi:unnamed protein product, partial [Phaeothamnion confervicola]